MKIVMTGGGTGGHTITALAVYKSLTKEDLTKEGLTKEGLTKEDLTKEDLTKEDLTKEGLTKEGLTKEGLTKEGLTKEDLTKEGLTKEGLTKEGLTKEGLTKEGLTKEDKNNILYIGSKYGLERDLMGNIVKYRSITTGKLRRYFSFKNFVDIFKVLHGYLHSIKILNNFKPKVVFSTGGYVSVPVVLAAKTLNIPIIIHEQTVLVGLANKIGGYFAKKVLVAFMSSAKYFANEKVIHTGQPLREEILGGSKDELYKQFEIKEEDAHGRKLPLIYITGGSQGSHRVNMVIGELLEELLEHCNIIHQCGRSELHDDFKELSSKREGLVRKERYVIRDFIYALELKNILSSCDLLIGRSGAGTVHEAKAFKIPSILIPLSIAVGNEQYHNAKYLEEEGLAKIIEEKDLTKGFLRDEIVMMLKRGREKTVGMDGFEMAANERIKQVILSI